MKLNSTLKIYIKERKRLAMGYYTKYEIAMYPQQNKKNELEIMREIAAKIHNCSPEEISDSEAEWCLSDHMKWYSHEADMFAVSKMYPEITFVLEGEGEEHEDMWVKYFNNGDFEACYAEITYPQPKNEKFQYMM